MLRSIPASWGLPLLSPASRYQVASRYVPRPTPSIVGVNPTSNELKVLKSPKNVSNPAVVFFPWASWNPVDTYHREVSLAVRFIPNPFPGNARTGKDENA